MSLLGNNTGVAYQALFNQSTAFLDKTSINVLDLPNQANSLLWSDGSGNVQSVTIGTGISFGAGLLSATGTTYVVQSADSNIGTSVAGATTTLTLSRTPTLRYVDFAGVNAPDIRSLLATNNTGRLISIVTSNGVNYDYNDISGIGTISLSGSPSLSGLTLGTYNGLLKATSGVVSTATAGTDYQAAFATGTSSQFFRGDLSLATLDTDSIPEGKTNLYYNDTRARGAFSAGTNITISPTGVITAATASGVSSVTGTVNQVDATPTVGAVVLTLPQNIHTGATPTFSGLNLSSLTASTVLLSDASKNLISASLGASLSLAAGALNAIQDIRTSATPSFTSVNISGATANTVLLSDASKNIISASLGLSLSLSGGTLNTVQSITTSGAPQFTGLTLSGLTASRLVMTDISRNIASVTTGSSLSLSGSTLDTIQAITTGSSPQFTGLTLSGLTASSLLLSNGSKALISGTIGSSLSLSGSTLDAIQDIRTSASPQFTNLGLGIASLGYMGLRMGGTQTSSASTNVYGILLGSNMNLTTASYGCYGLSMGFNNFDIPSGGAYNVFGLDINGSSMTKSNTGTITYSMGGRLLSPNVSASYAVGCGTDSLCVSSNGLPWTDRSSAAGAAYISNLLAVGALPATDRTCYVYSNRRFGVYSGMYPTSSSTPATDWYNYVAYANGGYLTGTASASYYGYYGSDSSGPNSRVSLAYSAYFRNPNFASTTAANYACYCEDLVVGSNSNPGTAKPTNGIYCSGGLRADGQISLGANAGILTGVAVNQSLSQTVAGTSQNVVGLRSVNAIGASSGTIASAWNIYSSINLVNNVGTINNAVSMYIDSGATAGTVTNGFQQYITPCGYGTNRYGLYVQAPTGGTNNYCAYFDDVSIGSTANRIAGGLFVNGTTRINSLSASSLVGTDANKQLTSTTTNTLASLGGVMFPGGSVYLDMYDYNSANTTFSFGGGTCTVTWTAYRIGKVVNFCWQPFNLTGANASAQNCIATITFGSNFISTVATQFVMPICVVNAGAPIMGRLVYTKVSSTQASITFQAGTGSPQVWWDSGGASAYGGSVNWVI